jgi:hypothetical protein
VNNVSDCVSLGSAILLKMVEDFDISFVELVTHFITGLKFLITVGQILNKLGNFKKNCLGCFALLNRNFPKTSENISLPKRSALSLHVHHHKCQKKSFYHYA